MFANEAAGGAWGRGVGLLSAMSLKTHTHIHTHILTVREPEAGLPIVTDVRAIGAMTIVRFDSARGRMLAVRPRGALGVDRVARKRHHHRAMPRDGRDEQGGREGVAAHLDACCRELQRGSRASVEVRDEVALCTTR